MHPISTLPDAALRSGTPLADAFLANGITTFHDACRWVKELPYGSNSRLDDAAVVFTEGRGTCFTKHGAIARLAAELGLDVHKNLGFYRMTEEIVPGVADVLRPHGLAFVPTIHCFLEHGPFRVDLTEGNVTGKNKDLDQFDVVVRVGPESSLQELGQQFDAAFVHYAAVEPRLEELGPAMVRDLVRKCHQQSEACRCSGTAFEPAAVAVVLHP